MRPWQRGLFRRDRYTITGGQAAVSDAPGLGGEMNPNGWAIHLQMQRGRRETAEQMIVTYHENGTLPKLPLDQCNIVKIRKT